MDHDLHCQTDTGGFAGGELMQPAVTGPTTLFVCRKTAIAGGKSQQNSSGVTRFETARVTRLKWVTWFGTAPVT